MFIEIIGKINSFVAKISFDTLVWIVWGSYVGIFVISLLVSLISPRARSAEKRPFLALTNAYSGVNLAIFLLKCPLAPSIIITIAFWVAGYLLYGILCFCSVKRKAKNEVEDRAPIPVQTVYTSPARPVNTPPAAKNSVKLEHAVSVTDSLLAKNLAKSDRQELEKLKNTLAILQIKGSLTPAETDILNDNFNALLKLMAKYNA